MVERCPATAQPRRSASGTRCCRVGPAATHPQPRLLRRLHGGSSSHRPPPNVPAWRLPVSSPEPRRSPSGRRGVLRLGRDHWATSMTQTVNGVGVIGVDKLERAFPVGTKIGRSPRAAERRPSPFSAPVPGINANGPCERVSQPCLPFWRQSLRPPLSPIHSASRPLGAVLQGRCPGDRTGRLSATTTLRCSDLPETFDWSERLKP